MMKNIEEKYKDYTLTRFLMKLYSYLLIKLLGGQMLIIARKP